MSFNLRKIELILWQVDLVRIDLVASWSHKSWSCGKLISWELISWQLISWELISWKEANKRWDLQALLSTEKVDVVAITETFLSADILNSELVDETSFTVFRRDHNRHGGGGGGGYASASKWNPCCLQRWHSDWLWTFMGRDQHSSVL